MVSIEYLLLDFEMVGLLFNTLKLKNALSAYTKVKQKMTVQKIRFIWYTLARLVPRYCPQMQETVIQRPF